MQLVVRGTQDLEEQSMLSKILLKELPNFMQPQEIHWREALPLNPNGKIDRIALYRELAGEAT